MSPASTTTDRAAALRAAVRRVGAERGLHGASMSQIAKAAGVAAGTAYVHYEDKDDLILAAYVEAKTALAVAALSGALAAAPVDGSPSREQVRTVFVQVWLAAHAHLCHHRSDALFILQVDVSPYWELAHQRIVDSGQHDLGEALQRLGVRDLLVDLPDEVLYELGLAPAVRLAARDTTLTDEELRGVAEACWAAITTDSAVTADRR